MLVDPVRTRSLKMTDTQAHAAALLSFTIDTRTAQIVKLQSLDVEGAAHELSEDEKATLAGSLGKDGVDDILEQAFEAGIACVLGNGGKGLQSRESDQDAEVRRLLLAPLIAASAAKRFLQPEVVHRAILETLIHDSMKQPPEGEGAAQPPSDEGASPRTN